LPTNYEVERKGKAFYNCNQHKLARALIVKENGKEAYYNEIDKILIPMEEFEKAVKKMAGIPITASSVEVPGIDDYILKSKKRVKKEIQEEKTD
jgi:hypothetical protein